MYVFHKLSHNREGVRECSTKLKKKIPSVPKLDIPRTT